MAVTTYTELKAAVASWSNRTDLTTTIPDCITIAEGRMNDMLILKDMESDELLTTTINVNYVALPTGFISPLACWIVVSNVRIPLTPVLAQQLPYSTAATQPEYYAIDGTNMRFDCPASAAFSVYLRCVKQSNLSGTVASNYLLTKRPDIYLAASLVELARFTRDVDLFNAWEPRFLSAVAQLKASDSRNRSIVPLRTDTPGGRNSSILSGSD